VRVGLVNPCRVQQPCSGRQRRWNVEDDLTDRDELLRQESTGAGRAFDRPTPRFEPCRERHQLLALTTPSTHAQHVDELLALVEHRRAVRSLVRIDSDHEHTDLLKRLPDGNAAAGNPEEIECSVLFRATPQPRPDR
jgi:hypothetical protein